MSDAILFIEKPSACGMGEGANCCAFLALHPDGFACGRTMAGLAGAIRQRLAAGTMNAKYDPSEVPFPECQRQRDDLVVLGRCPHGIDLDYEFCPKGCRI